MRVTIRKLKLQLTPNERFNNGSIYEFFDYLILFNPCEIFPA